MVLPAPHQRAAPSRAPAQTRLAHPVMLRARRAPIRAPHAESGSPFGVTFKRTFPWISFDGETTEPPPPISPPKPPTPAPVASPTPDSDSFAPPTPFDSINETEAGEVQLPVGVFKVKDAFPQIRELREAFGPMLPVDNEYTEWDPVNPALKGMSFKSTYDEGFCGHFSIPGATDSGAAATFQKVMAQSDPFTFIQEHLTTSPRAGRSDVTSDELVIFAPGLRTKHNTLGSQETAPARLQHYANTLGCSLAQLHIGTDDDQGDVELTINFGVDVLLKTVMKQTLEDAGLTPKEINSNSVVWWPGQRDKLEAGLAVVGFLRPLWQSHFIEMLKVNEKHRRPLVLMPYSRTAVEGLTALKKYIEDYEGPKEEVEALLRETLTVVSLGNGTRPFGWPDGPAYVHVGGWSVDQQGPPPAPDSSPVRGTDPGVFYEGVYEGGDHPAGADAVFVHSDWVWTGEEAHNFASSGSASLRLVLAMNKVTGFRELYNKLSAGEELKTPTFEQVKSAMALTESQEWMWLPGPGPWEGVGDLPSKQEAEKLVGEWM